jgi:hypothetical protein
MPTFNVNNDSVIALTANLERLNRSAFPSAVRNTLNKGAFETKKEIPKTAQRKFVTRQSSFFRKFSIVDKANGFDVNKMISTVGIDGSKISEIADNLESQEFGGMVSGKKLIPHDDARVSKSQNKRVQNQNHLKNKKIHDATAAFKSHKGTRKSKFISAVMSTAKSGEKYMMIKAGSTGMVYEVTAISQNIKSKKVNFKIKKLYSVRSAKTHNVKSSGFMLESVKIVSKNLDKYFVENAEFQFKKQLNRR